MVHAPPSLKSGVNAVIVKGYAMSCWSCTPRRNSGVAVEDFQVSVESDVMVFLLYLHLWFFMCLLLLRYT